ncbi:MAG: WD40 repeat domain-containing protein [Nitratireductor sp.]|nr:WD40 repeat domain-containing protein [Nitratireductor sp.]
MPTIANIEVEGHVEWAGFIADKPVFALADGTVVVAEGGEKRFSLHEGMTAAVSALDRKSLITGGEDGAIAQIRDDGTVENLREATGKWVDCLAAGPAGAVAAGSGKAVTVFLPDGKKREIAAERTVEGLAFAPKGMRLALARYKGVELVWINTQSPPQFLEWKGAHISVGFSPDGRYVVTSMQENALHGWRLADSRHMRMTGYPAKVRSMSWSAKGNWLASSGAPAAIVWPFSGKDGPMGKAPKELGAIGQIMVSEVAFHPVEEVLAIGYHNGMILAVLLGDGREAVLRQGGTGAITSLGWDRSGRRIAFGSEEGEAGIIDIAG